MGDHGCPKGHVWVTYPNAKVSVCGNCGANKPVFELPYNDPLRIKERASAALKSPEGSDGQNVSGELEAFMIGEKRG